MMTSNRTILTALILLIATSLATAQEATPTGARAPEASVGAELPAPTAEAERLQALLGRRGGFDRLAEPLAEGLRQGVAELRVDRRRRGRRRAQTASLATVVRSTKDSSLLLVKASELQDDDIEAARLRLDGDSEREFALKTIATDLATDLALVKIPSGGLQPVTFDARIADAEVGRFVVSVGAAGTVNDLSVVSVGARSIAGGGGFLGVTIEDADDEGGARVVEVQGDSAASKAGIVAGDIIVAIGTNKVVDRQTLIDGVSVHPPQSRIEVRLMRSEDEVVLEAVLRQREERRGRFGAFFNSEMMGGLRPSRRRAGFPVAVQHDARLRASECGGPVVGLDGTVLGVNIARAGRTKSFFLPASEVRRALTRLLPQDTVAPKASKASKMTGRLEEKDGTKILFLWGSPEERGYAEGKLMANEIFSTLEEFALSRNVVPQPVLWDTVIRPLVEKSFAFDANFEAWAKGMLRGITEGREGKIKISKLNRDLQVGDLKVVSCIPDLAGFMCSSFAAWGDATETGSTVVGRNLDYYGTPTMTKNSLIKVNAATKDRAAWVGVGWAGVAGCLTGYSENGTWIAIHDVYMKTKSTDKQYTSRMFALEEILGTTRPAAKPVEAALKILRDRRFALGCNAMFAWDGGPQARGASVLEFDVHHDKNGGATPRLPEKGQSFITCSNHHRLRSEKGHDCWRYGNLFKAASKIDAKSKLNLDRAWSLIKRSSVSMTIYRVVADLGTGEIQVERRLQPGKADWSKRLTINAKDLLREVAKN